MAATPAREAFLAAMRRTATPVAVVATCGAFGRLAVTVSAIASVSADPPIILACINRRSPVCDALAGNGAFTINLLSAGQAHVADTFAGRCPCFPPFDFGCAEWEDIGDPPAPLLRDALSSFHCHLLQSHDAGTHRVILGRVGLSRSHDVLPLIYTDHHYAVPQPAPGHQMTETHR